jgi:hypothetical protein
VDKLEEIIRANPTTPRMVILYRNKGGTDRFQWGLLGDLPVLTLVGYITRVQADLQFRSPEPCDAMGMVVLTGPWRYFVNPGIPVDPLVGMLETIKAALVGSRVGQSAAAQRVQVLGPDGTPMR